MQARTRTSLRRPTIDRRPIRPSPEPRWPGQHARLRAAFPCPFCPRHKSPKGETVGRNRPSRQTRRGLTHQAASEQTAVLACRRRLCPPLAAKQGSGRTAGRPTTAFLRNAIEPSAFLANGLIFGSLLSRTRGEAIPLSHTTFNERCLGPWGGKQRFCFDVL